VQDRGVVELWLADGDDAGTFETSEGKWQPGDTLIGRGNRRYPVTAVIPLELVEELVDRPLAGVLEVEPL
jgi:hypothetical protein